MKAKILTMCFMVMAASMYGQVPKDSTKLIPKERIMTQVLLHGYNNFNEGGWTVTFVKVHDTKDENRWVLDYEATAKQNEIEVRYLIQEGDGVKGGGDRSTETHYLMVSVPMLDMVKAGIKLSDRIAPAQK